MDDGTADSKPSYGANYPPPVYSFEKDMARYKHCAQVLTAISERLDKCKPPPMKLPDIEQICSGDCEAKAAARVPEDFRCAFLLENVDAIAVNMQWTVSSLSISSPLNSSLIHNSWQVRPELNSLLPQQNAAIWFYNCDIGHSFSHRIFNIRYNVIVMVFLWALDLAGDADSGK